MNLEHIDVFKLPQLPLSQNKGLPVIGAVYFFIVGGQVQYIGQSSKLRQRLRCHEIRLEIEDFDNCNIAWLELPDQTSRLQAESWFKEKFHPPLQSVWEKYQKNQIIDPAEIADQDYFTTNQAAALIGNITGERISQLVKTKLIEDVDYKLCGRIALIKPAGITAIKNRHLKNPILSTETNGSIAK